MTDHQLLSLIVAAPALTLCVIWAVGRWFTTRQEWGQ